MQSDPHAFQIFVDGSCFLNEKRRSGYAGFILRPDSSAQEQIICHGVRESTINRMELAACIGAMEWVREQPSTVSRVQIFSDSQYVIDGVRSAPYWLKNRWRNRSGRPIENPDLWKNFLRVRSKLRTRVDFGKVKGKSSALLRSVDKSAKEAARSGTDIDRGYSKGKIGRSTLKGASVMFAAAGQVIDVRVYGSKLAGKTDESKVLFQTYNSLTNECGAKYFAYARPEIAVELHRHHAYRVQMNGNPKYPQILALLDEIPLPRKQNKIRNASSPQ